MLSGFVIFFWISFYYESVLYLSSSKQVIIRFIGSGAISFIITRKAYSLG
jgi:hypothetical protein